MRILFILLAAICMAVPAQAEEKGAPFNLKHYGNFKKMMHTKNVEGVVDLKTALDGKHTYAVGAIKNAEGEITVYDNKAWLNYGKDGLDKATHEVPAGERAMLLVTASVDKWVEIVIPHDMPENELHIFILNHAEKNGLSADTPFPFLIEGGMKKLVWHVINGPRPDSEGHGSHAFINKLERESEQVNAILIGFYSGNIQGVFTHPRESWHTHVIMRNKKEAGHAEEFGVRKGAVLKLPLI